MYTFENFIERIAECYKNKETKDLEYKYFPEDNQLWINNRCSYLEISDDVIRMTVESDNTKLNKILEGFYDLEGTIKKNNLIIYTFKKYLYDILIRLRCTEELYKRANDFTNKVLHIFIERNTLSKIFNMHYPDKSAICAKIYVNLRRDNDGYYYEIRTSDSRTIKKIISNKDDYDIEVNINQGNCIVIIR